jgi:hypothetical protein
LVAHARGRDVALRAARAKRRRARSAARAGQDRRSVSVHVCV